MSASNRSFAAILAAALALAVVTCLGAVVLFVVMSSPPPGLPIAGTLFTVERGETAQSVAERLETARLIRSALAFRILAKAGRTEGDLKTGTYRIMPGRGSKAVLDELVSGKQALVRATLPEGYTLKETGDLLDRLGVAAAADFASAARDPALLAELGVPAASFEGYLFPDTYFFPAAYGAQGAIRAMLRSFRARLATIPEAATLAPAELHRRIVLASIVEREYRVADEAPLMASVFNNRLKIGMALQSCATVVYVITEKLGKPHPEVIYDRDTRLPDPYNTYAHAGLPPGPISNPGMNAIRSVFHPASTSYLYFRLVDVDAGRHHFSESLEEHLGVRPLFVKRVGG